MDLLAEADINQLGTCEYKEIVKQWAESSHTAHDPKVFLKRWGGLTCGWQRLPLSLQWGVVQESWSEDDEEQNLRPEGHNSPAAPLRDSHIWNTGVLWCLWVGRSHDMKWWHCPELAATPSKTTFFFHPKCVLCCNQYTEKSYRAAYLRNKWYTKIVSNSNTMIFLCEPLR